MSTNESKQGSEYALTVRKAAGLTAEDWPDERIGAVARTVAPAEASSAEIAMFLTVAHRYQLDPFLKQIWLAKDKGKLIILTGRDSFIAVAERDPGYQGFDSGIVYSKDAFRVVRDGGDITVHHEIVGFDRGEIIGAFCVAYHESRRPVLVLREWKDYKHLQGKDNWKNYGPDMVETRCITAALRRQYTISGIYSEAEFVDGELLPDAERMAGATKSRMEGLRATLEAAETQEVVVVEEVPAGTVTTNDDDPPYEDLSGEPGADEPQPPADEPVMPMDENDDGHSAVDEARKRYHAILGSLHITEPERQSWQAAAHDESDGDIPLSSTEWSLEDYIAVIDSLTTDNGDGCVKQFVADMLESMDLDEDEIGKIRRRTRYACEQDPEKRRELLDKLHADLLAVADEASQTSAL